MAIWSKNNLEWMARGSPQGRGLLSLVDLYHGKLPGSTTFAPAISAGKSIGNAMMGYTSFTPNAYQINEGASDRDYLNSLEGRGYQSGLASQLQDTMSGQGPTVAGLQMQQGIGRALADVGSQANSARGTTRASAFRNASLGGMLAAQEANRNAALLQAQEQLAARSQYGTVADQMRQQDLGARTQDIGIERGNQDAWMQQEALRAGLASGNAERAQKGTSGIMNMAGSALSGLTSASDIRAKEDVREESDEKIAGMISRLAKGLPILGEQRDNPASNPEAENLREIGTRTPFQFRGGYELPEGERSGMASLDLGEPYRFDEDGGVERALSKLDAYRFRYKPDVAARMAQETYVDALRPREGIMAQDLEKSAKGSKVVEDGPMGKMLDGKRALAFSLAGLANLDKRLRKVEAHP